MRVCVRECSMYEERFPEVDDVVMVQVKSIAEMGAYVTLLEYNNIEGMILLSELSRRRIRSISKLIKVGRQEPVMVLRVDKEKVGCGNTSFEEDTLVCATLRGLPLPLGTGGGGRAEGDRVRHGWLNS